MAPRKSVRKIKDIMKGIFWHTGFEDVECIDLILVLVVMNFRILLFEISSVVIHKKKYQHLYRVKNSLKTAPRLIQKEIYGQC